MATMIKCLSKEVQCKLRSGIAIFSLQQCVEELILNSIDAGATCVGVRMDMEAFKIQVIDNGSGMEFEDMDRVGNRYFTSKCSSIEDLDNLKFYGFRGEAVASIVSLAALVEMSSRLKSSVKTHVKVFKDGKGLDVFEAKVSRPSAGTTVVICNFFHNMPVRRKRMDAVLEGERIRQRLETISLMHPSVSFTLKNDCTATMLVQLPKARDTYHRFVQIHGLGRAQKLGEISHTHGQFDVTGYIGKEGHYNSSLQFLFVNDRLVLKTRIHKLLNLLLRKMSSSHQKNDSPDVQVATRSPKHKRGQELQGMYVLNIKCPYSEYDICLEPSKTLIEFKDWDGILLCLEEAMKEFLSRENLVAEFSLEDMEYASQKLFGTAGMEREGGFSHQGVQETMGDVPLEYIIGRTLASKLKGGTASDDKDGQTKCEESNGETGFPARGLELQTNRCTNKKCVPRSEETGEKSGEEPRCDPVKIMDGSVPVSKHDAAKEKVQNSHDTSEESQSQSIEHLPHLVSGLTCEKRKMTEEGNRATSVNLSSRISVRPAHNITQEAQSDEVLPQHQSTNGVSRSSVCHRKIRISDPYVHENLQVPAQNTKPLHVMQDSNMRRRENPCSSKRRFSSIGGSGCVEDEHKVCKDHPSAVLSKLSKVTFCRKLSLAKETGTLDKFRRKYGKSAELKPPVLVETNDDPERNHARVPQPDNYSVMNSHVLSSVLEQEEECDVTESQEMQNKFQSPPTLSMFTRLKPVAVEGRSRGASLAAKLCHLRQQKSEVTLSASTSAKETGLGISNDSVKDGNNNDQHPGDTALNPACIPSRSTSPQRAEREVVSVSSGDWLHHYDDSVGKMVYINKVTGLSRYEEPSVEETQVRCTSDVTNMAVSVVSKAGDEYRCYPFQMDVVFPFLPKSKAERVIASSSGPDNGGDDVETSNSLSSLYSEWNNPVFVRPPAVGVDISSEQADGLAVKVHNILFPYRFSKAMIHSMKVINQVDKKFLACLINTGDQEPASKSETEGNLLVLVDQHAAHERVRLEILVADSYEDDPEVPGERRLSSSTIAPPLEITVTEEELRLLRSCQPYLRGLGLEMQFSQAGDPRVLVGKVPMCFIEKESNELRRGRQSVIKPIVKEYLQEQIELLRSTGRVKGTLPLTVLNVLASLACHGAIKFNDSLSKDECCSLVGSLSSCQLPFQCAHGRPSMAPLVDVLHLENNQQESPKPNLQRLRKMYKAWTIYGN